MWAYLCSEKELAQARERGEDADKLAGIYAEVINTALKSKPADMVITTHVCRGNFRSTWISEGGYEPVAELLLGGVNYDGYFLEYDSDRAGGLEPLRFLPKGKKRVVVGLVTSKTGELEKKDDIKRRLDEAGKYAPIDQLCLSPQCGFASTEEGNVLSRGPAVGQAQDDRRYFERGLEELAGWTGKSRGRRTCAKRCDLTTARHGPNVKGCACCASSPP